MCSMKLQMLGCHNTSGFSGTHKVCVIMEKVHGGVTRYSSPSEFQLIPVNTSWLIAKLVRTDLMVLGRKQQT